MIQKTASGWYWHCHHCVLCEWVYDYPERRAFIKQEKPAKEQWLRLLLFKRVKAQRKFAKLMDKQRVALHAKECRADCPWDGEVYGTIFTTMGSDGMWTTKPRARKRVSKKR